MYLLSKFSDDQPSKSYLKRNAERRAEAGGYTLTSHGKVTSKLPTPGTKITPEELDKVTDILPIDKN